MSLISFQSPSVQMEKIVDYARLKRMTEAGDDQKRVAIEGGDQQRPVKRVRREKGSSAKERTSKIPPCVPGKRSSIYRGVTRHRWTGRYEAHLWDKSTWNQTQNKKGKQVYLGAYDEEEAAARAYDLAALKYWGAGTLINFPVIEYAKDIEEMQNVSREEYLASLRRKSSGFSRGVSKYRGVARHHHNGRWEARIGRVFGNKYLYLGTYSTQEEAAAAYDMAAIEYRGLNAVTNFDLSRYIRWLRPGQADATADAENGSRNVKASDDLPSPVADEPPVKNQQTQVWPGQPASEPYELPSLSLQLHPSAPVQKPGGASAPTALSLLLQSSMFKSMLERASSGVTTTATEPKHDAEAELGHILRRHQPASMTEDPQESLYGSESSLHCPQMFHQGLQNGLFYNYGGPAAMPMGQDAATSTVADSQPGPAFSWNPFGLPIGVEQLATC